MPENGRWDVTRCLTLIVLTWRIWWAPNNASRWQMKFNSAFKELTYIDFVNYSNGNLSARIDHINLEQLEDAMCPPMVHCDLWAKTASFAFLPTTEANCRCCSNNWSHAPNSMYKKLDMGWQALISSFGLKSIYQSYYFHHLLNLLSK